MRPDEDDSIDARTHGGGRGETRSRHGEAVTEGTTPTPEGRARSSETGTVQKDKEERAGAAKEERAGAAKEERAGAAKEERAGAAKERAGGKAARTRRSNFRQLRLDRMMSKAELARRAGVSTLTIDRIERGLSCRMDTKRKILEALGLKPQDRVMVFGEDE
jgi:DNA-binding XRE family transcriptional regulator